MRAICKSGSVRGVKLSYMAEYCGTPQSKERRNGEYKVCLNERASRLLDCKSVARLFSVLPLLVGINDKESSHTPPLSYSEQRENLRESSTGARNRKG